MKIKYMNFLKQGHYNRDGRIRESAPAFIIRKNEEKTWNGK